MNDKANMRRKIALPPIIAAPIVILFAALSCQKLHGQGSPRSFYPQANYTADYIEKNKGKVLVEIPEVYELANIAVAISDYGLKDPGRVHKHGAYYERILDHFRPFKDDRLIKEQVFNNSTVISSRCLIVC